MIQPRGIDLKRWADSLVVDFPTQSIPMLGSGENDWKDWGNDVVSEDIFSQAGAPDTSSYNDWESWANAVFQTMANY